tara:strand:- start:2303 stop:2968 length:666 start_codon:yes stop_codon:yes gene_type:complete
VNGESVRSRAGGFVKTAIARSILLLCAVAVVLTGCATNPPSNADDICAIFDEKRKWYRAAAKARTRWGSSIPVMMAFAYQESSFKAKARPPRRKILGFIPGPRPASAYGFAQATNETWQAYRKSTGRWGADRDDFGDAMDFVGWYNEQSNRRSKIAKTDAYNLYLAYHEGHGGFNRRSHAGKAWLKDAARKVASRSDRYGQQLSGCEKRLKRGWLSRLLFR